MIRMVQLNKSYNNKQVIKDLSVELEEGSINVLMGQSGSGKTTLAHMLLGLVYPDSGSIEGLRDKNLSAVFQEDRLCEQLTAVENIQLVIKKHSFRDQSFKKLIEKELKLLGLDEDSMKKPVCQLSGGQKRRIAIVRAIMAESDCICLDEPFKGLDQSTKLKTMEYVKQRSEGKTILLITHDIGEAEYFGGKRIYLKNLSQ